MALKVCAEAGCPTLTKTTRCVDHTQDRDRARGTSTQRGYGYDHQQQRAAWLPKVMTGTVTCRRCPKLLNPNEPWDLGHPDADCPKPLAPECWACNRATSGRHA